MKLWKIISISSDADDALYLTRNNLAIYNQVIIRVIHQLQSNDFNILLSYKSSIFIDLKHKIPNI